MLLCEPLDGAGNPICGGCWIRVGSLDSAETRPLVKSNSNAVFANTAGGEYILFSRESALLAQRFDPAALVSYALSGAFSEHDRVVSPTLPGLAFDAERIFEE